MLVLIACHGSAALHVPEDVVPGVTDLPRKQAERVDRCAVAWCRDEEDTSRHDQAGVRAFQVCPISLGFQAEYPGAGLPAIADLSAGHAARRVMATLSTKECPIQTGVLIPALVAPSATTIEADVKAAPIVDRRNHWHRSLGGIGRAARSAAEAGAAIPNAIKATAPSKILFIVSLRLFAPFQEASQMFWGLAARSS